MYNTISKKISSGFLLLFSLILFIGCQPALAQKKKKDQAVTAAKHYLDKVGMSGLKWRSVGPAMTSGRISDFAVHPDNRSMYYVATASGGVWKTTNAGTTYQPIFDGQGSYSIGCVTLDPNNTNTVWVGTGENNNQRSVGFGDGVYKSMDGGKSWKNMGLKNSEHIGKIIVHPDNSNVVYVAAIGPLWSEGGDRGVYKTTDGGATWKAVLTVDKHTGANDLVMDPRNPEVIYASMHQRRRHVFTYVGGGPGSGMHKSTDGGETWTKINSGLPSVEMGRIGLAISPANPEYIYAIVEAAQGKGGFYRSTNRGASWEKRSSYTTSGNYYQEIFAHPTQAETVYSMSTWNHVTTDGGKSFQQINERWKHVDNHVLYIDPDDPNYMLVGCDGGIYESFDGTKTYQFKANLPITQFYKVAVDNTEPFYYIYGGTQDNFSMGGPSRTRNGNGIPNSDWFVTQGGDGFESAIDPDNPNIVYAQYQYGGLTRYDKASGENMSIQPKPKEGEEAYNFNWDAPLQTSAHVKGRIYFAANKLFRSDDRGNTWDVISPDLTAQIDRNKLKVMGRVQSIDAVMKNQSTSVYGAIVAFHESPLNQDLLYVGTDDGLIQVSSDGGKNWQKKANISGVPANTYVNQIVASQHDENVVYACFNDHKRGNFKPYVYKSSDKGLTWRSITNNLPAKGTAYTIAEDHVDKNLLFVGTEYSCFFSNNGGGHWKKLSAGLPTIAVRDMAIQERENDLVLATFGRGFYVLDDYSSLRNTSEEVLAKDAHIFPITDGLIFVERTPLGLRGNSFQGDSYYAAKNPPIGATFTYFVKEQYKTLKEQRQEKEKKAIKEGKDTPYPSYEELEAEQNEEAPYFLFTISDINENVVRKIKTGLKKGVNRITWDGRIAYLGPISLRPSRENIFGNPPETSFLAMPGSYTVSLSQSINGKLTELVAPTSFVIRSLGGTTLRADNIKELTDFHKDLAELQRQFLGTTSKMGDLSNKLKHIRKAIYTMPAPAAELEQELLGVEKELASIRKLFYGDRLKSRLDQPSLASLSSRIWATQAGFDSTSDPTTTAKEAYRIATKELQPQVQKIQTLVTQIKTLEGKLEAAGAPYTPGRNIEWRKN